MVIHMIPYYKTHCFGRLYMDKKITIPIGEEDIRLFQELIYYDRESFEWRFDGVDIKFIKDEGEEE